MLKIPLASTDLANVRFAVSPINQAVMAGVELGRRRPVRPARSTSSATPRGLDLLMYPLAAQPGYRPDFLTPVPSTGATMLDLGDELDILVGTPEAHISADLDEYRQARWPANLEPLLAREDRALRQLADTLRDLHRSAFGRDWGAGAALLRADIARRSQQLAYHGLDAVLSDLHPRLSASDGVLTLTSPIEDAEPQATGTGLVLVPSLVAVDSYAVKINPRDPVVVVYPVGGRGRPARAAAPAPEQLRRRLGALVGRSRAAVLIALFNSAELRAASPMS